MKATQQIYNKIFTLPELQHEIIRWRLKSKSIVFTNGVFDLLHEGHLASIHQAASLGHVLIIGLNADSSVKRLKGPSRPVHNEQTRARVLASMLAVDAVVIFEDDTPLELIKAIMPDVLVKGGDYTVEQIAGAKEVMANGGQVVLADIIDGISTTKTIQTLQ
jgi:D-beta-D-heptose 7-phosphate kinase/D-beta-D-heptose 1-phosphate adenosyltransferase